MVSKFIKNQVKGAFVLGALLASTSVNAQLGLTWSEMGPNDIAGRTRSIMVSSADASKKTLYCGGASGGVFKSTDGGANWSPVNDLSSSLIVSSLAQTADGSTIYFGTGEAFGRGGDGAGLSGFIGTGLFKFSTGSTSITLVKDSTQFGDINEVTVVGTNTIYVAGQKGLFFSTDGGATFNEEDSSAVNGRAAMDVKISSAGDVYYSAGTKDLLNCKVYRKLASSSNFTNITPTSISNRGRIEIALAQTDANYVYLSIAKQKVKTTASTGGLSAVLVSDTKGTSWSVVSLGTAQFDPLSASGTGYGDYSNTIVVDPGNSKIIYIGGELFYAWQQLPSNPLGQGNWYQIGTNVPVPMAFYIHSKIHAITFDITNALMYIATDGGIFKSTSGNSGFLPYNKGLNISQFNSVSFPNFPRINQGTQTNVAIPYAGVAGGSIGNSITYLPGYYGNGIQTSKSFGYTDAYQSDFSRILPKAAFYSGAFGSIFRASDIDVTPFSTFYDQSYKGGGNGSLGSSTFANENTPMRLWENYNSMDSVIFYNEIAKTSFINTAVKASFLTKSTRSQLYGKYDTIIISAVSTKSLMPPPTQTINLIPVYTGTNITSLSVVGDADISSASNNTIFINSTLKDSVKYTFLTSLDSSVVSITFKLRYDAGDPITITNTDISGGYITTSLTLTSTLYATASATSMPTVKLPLRNSAKLAVGMSRKSASEYPAVYIVKRPLNFSLNPDWVKVAGKNSRMDGPGGVASSTVAPVLGTVITRLEWANDGKNIYFSSKNYGDTCYLYRVSHLEFIGDSSDADYGGVFTSDVDSLNANTMRKKPGQRTTALGKFYYPITSISVSSDNKTLLITTGGYNNNVATVYTSNGDVTTMNMNNTDQSNFTAKNGTGATALPFTPAYSSLIEMNDNKRALIGTENGIYSTSDITQSSPTWFKESGGNFPNVPVFQIRQQTYPSYKCYNSGIIYVATHGRGIWSTDKYLTNYAIGVEENQQTLSFNSNIRLFPNPTADAASLAFNSKSDATYKITVYDISGRILIENVTGKLMEGEQLISLNTSSLNSGVYFVTITGSNNFNETTKMVITR